MWLWMAVTHVPYENMTNLSCGMANAAVESFQPLATIGELVLTMDLGMHLVLKGIEDMLAVPHVWTIRVFDATLDYRV